ncbi:GRP family sugar transporter, partial [Staphylococcus epidermidis]|uniref:GRP family sugar transporter n=1 Tax=Staphylococcus epidermidis TaxID=1282 RepID=UPI001C92CFC1
IPSNFPPPPLNQIFPPTLPTLIFPILLPLFKPIRLPARMPLLFSLISPPASPFAQIITFKPFQLVASSTPIPITTPFQLLGPSLSPLFPLPNSPPITNKIIPFLALLLILIPARITLSTQTKQQQYTKNLTTPLLLLLLP